MSEDLKGIRVNGTLWEVADVDARAALENKLDTPAGGNVGQVLTRTADGYTWQTVEGGTEFVTYTAGTGIEITDENIINCTVTPGNAVKYTAGENITISEDGIIAAKDTKYSAGTGIEITDENVINCTVTPGEGVTYTAGEGIEITEDNVINCTVTPGEGVTYTAGENIEITDENVINCTITDYVTQSTFENTIGEINSILDDINGEVL
jgi:hypothetical protein